MAPVPYLIGTGTNPGSTSVPITPGVTTTLGDTIVVASTGTAAGGSLAATGCIDTAGNTYTLVMTSTAENPIFVFVSYNSAVLSGSSTITVTWNASTNPSAGAVGCTGLFRADQLVQATSAGPSAAVTVTSGALAAADETCIAVTCYGNGGGGTLTWGGSFAALFSPLLAGSLSQYMSMAYENVTATTPVTASATIGSATHWATVLLTFYTQPAITGTWTGSYSRTPTAYVPGPPPLSPLAVPVANTAGQWLFAVVSWRQDAGTAGVLRYPSSVNISDDAGNFWVPLQPGQHSTGIVRCAIWMAPAARAAGYVFVAPDSTVAGDAYQSALDVLILEVTAGCPWYEIGETDSGYANQGTSVSVTQANTSTGLFSVGVLAWDNVSATVSTTATGWTATASVTTSNGTDHSGDLKQETWYAATAGSSLTLSASSATTMDWAGVLISVQGVTNVIPFQYTVPDAENWPVLVTEIGAGPVINADPVMLQGTAHWSAANGTAAPVTWPVYQPWPDYQALITPSLSLTPSGSATTAKVASELEAVSPSVRYNALAYVYSEAGYGDVTLAIDWFTSGASYISSSTLAFTVPAGAWTQLTLLNGVFPPGNAALADVSVTEVASSGDVPSTAVLYIGYAALGLSDSYENTPVDDIQWADVSTRNFTQGDIKISRGIQYQQQSLEAGTMTAYLASNDGAMMFGNILSSYWPNIGDTDVPIRLRAIWQQSLTPYYPLFSGYTDEMMFGWDDDEGTWYGYAEVEASDAWSRLTSQMIGAAEQEILLDSPVAYCPCSISGTNLAIGNNTPVTTLTSQVGAGAATAGFNGSGISLAGDPGASCWQSQGTPAGGFNGVALGYFPPQPVTITSEGITAEFWMSPTQPTGGQPAEWLTICTCWSRKGPMWTISVNNTAGAGSSTASITVYDQNTSAGTTTSIGAATFLGATTAAEAWQFAVTFTQTSLTVVASPGGVQQELKTVSANLNEFIVGFSFGGNAGPVYGYNNGGTTGFMNIAVYGFAVFSPAVPPARQAAHHQAALNAFPLELDTSRLARIAGYAGATPVVLAMRCLDLAVPPAADVDAVTGATDTSGQVVSSYFTNVAASTFAFMFADGAGALAYRRRLEAYDRASPQWVLGEYAAYPVNANTLSGPSAAGWSAGNGAALSSGSVPNGGNAGPWFQMAGLFHGDGATPGPYLFCGSLTGTPVTPGEYYSFSALFYSPQGWTTGVTAAIQFYTSGAVLISSVTTAVTPLGAASLLWLTTGPVQAPATAAYMAGGPAASGTPASAVLFYVTEAVFAAVGTVTAGGAGATAPEVPYLSSAKLSSDRALLYNQAILTQYGTSIVSTFSGTGINFGPSSGVVVIITNTASVTARAGVPYTATIYIDNTAQALPYMLNEPAIEDVGNWVTQTLASPLLRPETVTITPAATPQAMLMGLGAEIGDTATMRRRPQTGGAPEIQVQAYVSKLSHTISIAAGKWDTEYEISPFPQGQILACDDVIHGTNTGGNLLGF